jgi:hypothetical protein
LSDIVIRPATDEDGPAIGKLFSEAKYDDHGVDWTQPDIGSWWVVAEHVQPVECRALGSGRRQLGSRRVGGVPGVHMRSAGVA